MLMVNSNQAWTKKEFACKGKFSGYSYSLAVAIAMTITCTWVRQGNVQPGGKGWHHQSSRQPAVGFNSLLGDIFKS